MIEPYDLIYYEEQFIKPPKRGKLYSKDEFASYTSKIACIGGQLYGNFVALEKLAKQIDKEINQKVGERRWVESNVKELFFSYRGRVYSIVNFHARKLENKSTWTYDNVITLHRKTVEDVVKLVRISFLAATAKIDMVEDKITQKTIFLLIRFR